MYQGKYNQQRGKRRRKQNKKPLLLLASLVLIFALATTGTLAWLTTNTEAVQNTMLPASVPITIDEQVSGTTKTSVVVTNYGNTDAYIRVAIVANAVNSDGNIVADEAPRYSVSSNWTPIDGYYYYNGIVHPSDSTAKLFSEDVSFANGEINILAESIQVLGGFGTQKPEQYAWGVTYNNGSWSK